MELAQALLKLWALRLWIGVGLVLSVAAAAASLTHRSLEGLLVGLDADARRLPSLCARRCD